MSGRWQRTAGALAGLIGLSLGAPSHPAHARWPPPPERDGVYGRFGGNTDFSLKLGGHVSESQLAGSVGASVHYYSTVGLSLDYVEALSSDTRQLRGLSVGSELRPLFLPRFLLGRQQGPAWLDLTLDSVAIGFGGYWAQAEGEQPNGLGIWTSAGIGVPLLGLSTGPWLELRALRRFPDPQLARSAHNALFVYLSWHHYAQLGPAR
jgi:hypothetical protein